MASSSISVFLSAQRHSFRLHSRSILVIDLVYALCHLINPLNPNDEHNMFYYFVRLKQFYLKALICVTLRICLYVIQQSQMICSFYYVNDRDLHSSFLLASFFFLPGAILQVDIRSIISALKARMNENVYCLNTLI